VGVLEPPLLQQRSDIDEHEHWRKRDLSAKHYVYVWADGIYLQARLEDAKQCSITRQPGNC